MAGNTTKVYHPTGPDGGDRLVVEDGGTIELAASTCLEIDGTALTADADELNKLDGAGDVVASGTAVSEESDVSVSISDISDSATGAEIATAVNALIDTVETLASAANASWVTFKAFGLMESS